MFKLTRTSNGLSDLVSEIFSDVSNGIEKYNPFFPKINTSETDDNFQIDVYYPGLKKEDYKVKVENKTLTISSNFSEDKEEKSEKYHYKEFYQKTFSRNFILPDEIIKNKIKASCEDGILKIMIPKDKIKEKQSKFDVNIE
jgi:HSP20 family protein